MTSELTVPCPVCGSASEAWAVVTDVEYHTSEDEFDYLRCPSCRTTFIHPMPVDRLTEIYPANYYSYSTDDRSWVERVKERLDRRRFRKLLAGIDGATLAALDVGGGDGWLLSVMRSVDPRVSSTQVVDLDPSAEVGAVAHGHRYHCGRIEDFDTEEQFDVILLLNLIEHVADPSAVLDRLRTLLRRGGVMLVKTPNVDSVDARLFRHRGWGGYHCPRHWVLFTMDSFRELATRQGFEVRSATYTQGAPFWAVGVLAVLERRGLVRTSAERPMVEHPLFTPLLALFGGFDLVRSRLGGHPSQMVLELTPVR
jgi:SAM-dependent methyltransferase